MRISVMSFVVLAIILSFSPLEAKAGKAPPQAAPVMAVLQAVKESDVKAFRNAYSWRIREDKEQGNWEKNLQEAQTNIKKMYGDYQLSDFTFTYSGDQEQGKVFFTFKKNGKSTVLDVVNEGGEWKVDMR
jgi:hypothetical protein